MRQIQLERNTKETKITLSLNLDGIGKANIDTKIGFFNHMLELFAFHGKFDLTVKCDGDIEVDSHHTIEDVGILLGEAFKKCIGDKKGINRYGAFTIPMDEALITTHIDISNRPFLVFHVDLDNVLLGNFQSEMVEEFFRAFAFEARITLHINMHYGKNTHHIIEGCFKSFSRALKQASRIDEERKDEVISSKGVL